MIKFTILYSILNGDLIPWLNHHESFTSQIDPYYLRATASYPANDLELHEQVTTLVAAFPTLSTYLKSQAPASPNQLIPSFYSIQLPQHTDTFTAYYYLTFRQEALRLFNLIINQYQEMDDQMKSFLVNENLKELKYLALSLTDKMKEKGYSQTPNPQTEPVLYALYAARHFVIHLFFGLQEVFANVVKSLIIPKAFFQTFLKELYSESHLHPSQAYYEHKLMFYIDNNVFSFNAIKAILDDLKANNELEQKETVIAKYENAIYLYSLNQNPGIIQNLLNHKLVSELFSSEKATIQNKINSLQLGLDRLDVVNEEINKLYYTDGSTKNHYSIPSLLHHWLASQAAVYTNAASNSFAPISDKRPAANPQAIITKVQVEEQKSIAYQHFLFLKGVNPQNQTIISSTQFDILITGVNELIETDLVPEIKNPLPQINLPTNYIRYTFYLLHKTLFTTKTIRESWINFLHDMFTQFNSAERSTTRAKFSEMPPMYYADFKHLKK